MKNLILTITLALLATSGAQAQLNDSLVACSRNISLLVVRTDKANFSPVGKADFMEDVDYFI